MNCITVALLIYGIFEMKSFLNKNFIENDTEIKRKVDRAFKRGELKKRNKNIQNTHSSPTNNRNGEIIIDVKSTK